MNSHSAEGEIAKARSDLRALVNGKAATIVSNKAKYTSASYAAFEKKLKIANTLLSEDDTTETEVKDANTALNYVITNGMVLEAETQEHKDAVKLLEDALSKADGKTESDYTAASWKTFKTARDKATTIKANPSAYTTEDITNAITALTSAIDNLESAYETLRSQLTDLYLDVEGEKEHTDLYTEDSFKKFLTALTTAREVIDKKTEATVNEIKSAITNLENAVKGLKEYADILKEYKDWLEDVVSLKNCDANIKKAYAAEEGSAGDIKEKIQNLYKVTAEALKDLTEIAAEISENEGMSGDGSIDKAISGAKEAYHSKEMKKIVDAYKDLYNEVYDDKRNNN